MRTQPECFSCMLPELIVCGPQLPRQQLELKLSNAPSQIMCKLPYTGQAVSQAADLRASCVRQGLACKQLACKKQST